mgnify:CR=1 FL=1
MRLGRWKEAAWRRLGGEALWEEWEGEGEGRGGGRGGGEGGEGGGALVVIVVEGGGEDHGEEGGSLEIHFGIGSYVNESLRLGHRLFKNS